MASGTRGQPLMDSIEAQIEKLETEKTHNMKTRQLCQMLYQCLPPALQSDQGTLDEWRLADVTAASHALRRAQHHWRSDPAGAASWLHVAMRIFETCDMADYPFPHPELP